MKRTNQYPDNPKELWEQFLQISQIPRASKHEDKISEYIINLAAENRHDYSCDDFGNIVVRVKGEQGRDPVILQNHMDMVCDKLQGHTHDFLLDPIKIIIDGEKIKALGTTLGADNGLGMSAACALMTLSSKNHPPLELLFTRDEETGLNGALNLDVKMLQGKVMFNLDSDDWGKIIVGSAGGMDINMGGKFDLSAPTSSMAIKIAINGLGGGHSGTDIFIGQGNAIKLLVELLLIIKESGIKWEISRFEGGKAHNIIPREAHALIHINENDWSQLKSICLTKVEKWKKYLPQIDHRVNVQLDNLNINVSPGKVLNASDTANLLSFISLLPHGVGRFNRDVDPLLPNFSSNLAICTLIEGEFCCLKSARYFNANEVVELEQKIKILAKTFNMELKIDNGYPSWDPDLASNCLNLAKVVYTELFGDSPIVTAIHAGLECGIIKDKINDLQVISFGPQIEGAHSPDESVNVDSVTKFWDFLCRLLEKI